MDTDISNSWALYQIKGWKEANNALDTLLCYEYAQASQRRYSQYESQIQSAWAIRDNMLDRMNNYKAYGARETEPEHRLIHNICTTLKLPQRSITPHYRDRTS
ncbi:hypothetical protein MNBD_GAMMA11-344 [hydrothermal vent metagenome]|uniref:Uncharacterized protein n=1 Tax=hydrothermal vent metagenome TaxID=652676 RepID=A0A3B0Y9N9_9ZZZZ